MYRSSSFRSTLNTSYIRSGHVKSMHRSSPIRSTLNQVTSEVWACVKYVPKWFIPKHFEHEFNRGLGMCKVCTETVHSVALWTRVTSEVWACVKYVPKWFIPKHFEHEFNRGLGMCKVCTEAIHSEALWTRVTSEVWACVKYVEAVVFHSSTLLSFYSSILLLFRSVALLCCCSSILLAGRNLASSSFGNDRLTSADLGPPRLSSARLGWPRPEEIRTHDLLAQWFYLFLSRHVLSFFFGFQQTVSHFMFCFFNFLYI